MFTPLRSRGALLANRVVITPTFCDTARDGLADASDWALLVRGARAGAGLVLTDVLAVSADGRVSSTAAGLYRTDHAVALQGACELIHGHSEALVGVQIGHAGRRGATRPRSQGIDRPLENGWALISASPIAYSPRAQVPHEMERSDMDRVIEEFLRAARLAEQAGGDWLQLHFAQGYLAASFLSPLSNRRVDRYGGSLENRAAFPLEILAAVRAAWPPEKPLSVALSALDWASGGFTADEAVAFARMLKTRGCDVIDVHAGQTLAEATPSYRPYFATLFSDRIRNEAGIATLISGYLNTSDEINGTLAAARADLYRFYPRHLEDLPGL
jgi:anthraniloyl-CoA monooxygenase